jgi:NADH-ubiquinone oxidoreductase chain 2
MLLTSLFLLLLSNGLTIRKDVSILYSRIAIFILMYCIINTYVTFYITYIEKGLGLYNGLFNATAITHTFQIFIFISSLIILLLTGFFPRKLLGEKKITNNLINLITNKMTDQYTIIEYALIILFVVIGGSLLLSSGDFISLFLCIELQSYGLYILSVIYRDSESATSSGLTYFLLGGLSSCFILLGIVFIYVNTGVSSLDSFYVLTNLTSSSDFLSPWYKSEYITYSLLIISVGLLFKIAAAPFHFWSPDVYDGIPTIVTTFVANMAKISILVIMLDLVHYTSETVTKTTFDWTTGILISCLLSLVIGTILGLTQTRIKRLFAYSTISHVGFMLLTLGVNTIESSKAFIFYLLQYTLTNINTFMILIGIGFSLYLYANNNLVYLKLQDKNNSPIQLISQIKGYFYINPILSICLAITMLSFAGIPPLAGFFAKQMVLSSALDNGYIFLVITAVLTSVIGAVYYLGIIKTMFFDKSDYIESNLKLNITLSSYLSIPISILTLMVLLFMFIPNEPLYLTNILTIVSFTNSIFV